MKKNIIKILLIICVITVFGGCFKIEMKKLVGTKWRSNSVWTNNAFLYIRFIDNATFEYCLVDYDLNRLSDMKKSSYIRTSDYDIIFSTNDVGLGWAQFGRGNVTLLIIIPINSNGKTLSVDGMAFIKAKHRARENSDDSDDSDNPDDSEFEDKYLW